MLEFKNEQQLKLNNHSLQNQYSQKDRSLESKE